LVFSSTLFLGIFLPVTIFLYYLSKNITYKNIILLTASLLFYAWGEPVLILVMLFSSFVAYVSAFGVSKWRGSFRSKLCLIFSLVVVIGILVVYKYSAFLVDIVNALFGTQICFKGFALPLGISFYTFQIITYVIDVYRNDASLQRSYYKFLLYVSMFPQLVAGPIVRYTDIEHQINQRSVTFSDFEYGVIRFTQGLFKKVILANYAGSLVNQFIGGSMARLSASGAWFGIIMYTFQIYFDFSAYSDMAIGLGRLFGFKFRENFNYPYTSGSVTEFWRRWHISLGSFFRDYVYIPLGGNRRHQLLNIGVVWLLTGIWHGASWNFILWGVYYGLWLVVEKKIIFKFINKIPAWIRCIYTNIVVVGGWMLFYFTDFSRLREFLSVAFSGNPDGINIVLKYRIVTQLWLLILMVICSTPVIKIIVQKLRDRYVKLYNILLPVAVGVVMMVCFALLVKQSYNPFLYFRF